MSNLTKEQLAAAVQLLFGDKLAELAKAQEPFASPSAPTPAAEPESAKELEATEELSLPTSQMHKVVIVGRGEVKTRQSTLVRLRPDILHEIRKLVDGPMYLTIELALRRYIEELKKRPEGSVEMIRAEDLGSGSSGRVS